MLGTLAGQKSNRVARQLVVLIALSFFVGCSMPAYQSPPDMPMIETPADTTGMIPVPVTEAAADESGLPPPQSITRTPEVGAELYPGSGRFIRSTPPNKKAVDTADGITLNFIETPIDQVVASVLGQILKLNYVIEPGVQGQVTIQTTQPIPRDSLISTLETVLGLNGAALVEADGIYKIVRLSPASRVGAPIRSLRAAGPHPRGYAVQVVPLNYIAAPEMEKILESLALKENLLRADATRNLLILAGTEPELASLNDAIEIFDVDWLAGMSFGLFPIQFANAKTLGEELEKIFQKGTVDSQLVQFVPIERLNTILVVTQQSAYLERAKTWIDRLDQQGDGSARRIYVYYVQNARAERLAASLTEIFAPEEEPQPTGLAPGQKPTKINAAPQIDADALAQVGAAAETRPEARVTATPSTAASAGDGIVLPAGGRIRVIADTDHNALIVLATPQEYKMVEATMRKLDIVPLQVLIQATVFEVRLTDNLRYGVRWFFESGESSLLLNNLPAVVGGFSYAFNSTNFDLAIDALASITDLKVISSPELLVLDNQTASLQVGDQVPVATRQSTSVTDPEAPVVNSIQFRNTGVILRVTPRVNAGGLVTMEIEQEVSNVTPTETPTVTPTIFQRTISSTVAVTSGESVALGGLISENKRAGQSGVPILKDIPIVGALFRSTSEEIDRTELLVLITPRVVRNQAEARTVTSQLKRRMGRVERLIREAEDLKASPTRGTGPQSKSPAPADSTVSARGAERSDATAMTLLPQSGATDESSSQPRSQMAAIGTMSDQAVSPDSRTGSAYFVHLASYRTHVRAADSWLILSERFPSVLGHLQPLIQDVDLGQRGIFYRLNAGPIADRAQVRAVCRRLEKEKQYCQIAGG